MRLSLRKKIILSFLFVIIFGGLISLIIGWRLVKNTLITQAQAKVRHDLAAAWLVFNGKLNDIKDIVTMTSSRESLHQAVRVQNREALLRILGKVRQENGLDALTICDHQGKVILRSRNPEVAGNDQSTDEFVRRALKGQAVTSPQVIPREELLKEGSQLANQAYMEFITTAKPQS